MPKCNFDILKMDQICVLISLHIRMWETTVMHKQVSGWTVNFGPNFPDQSLLRNTPPHFGKLKIWDDQSLLWNTPPPFQKTSDLGWPKFTPEYPPSFWKTSDLGWPKFTPEYPPISENFRFGMTKVYAGIPPHPISENFRFGMTKAYSGIPPTPTPILENFRFGMTKVYSGIPPHPPKKIVRKSRSEIFWIARFTTCGDFIQPG